MNIFKKLLHKLGGDDYETDADDDEIQDEEQGVKYRPNSRVQFNTLVAPKLKEGIHLLANSFGLPKYTIVEHALVLGLAQVLTARERPEELKLLWGHLAECHLLREILEDEPQIRQLGQNESRLGGKPSNVLDDPAWGELMWHCRKAFHDTLKIFHSIDSGGRYRGNMANIFNLRAKIKLLLVGLADFMEKLPDSPRGKKPKSR